MASARRVDELLSRRTRVADPETPRPLAAPTGAVSFVGVGFTGEKAKTYQYAATEEWASVPLAGRQVRARITNDRNVVTYHYSLDDGETWQRHPTRMEVSGLNHNVFGGFLWTGIFLFLGYFFGNIPVVRENFELVIPAIILISVLPMFYEWWRERSRRKQRASEAIS